MDKLLARMRARRPFYFNGHRYEAGEPIREEDRKAVWSQLGRHYIELVKDAPDDKIAREPETKGVESEGE